MRMRLHAEARGYYARVLFGLREEDGMKCRALVLLVVLVLLAALVVLPTIASAANGKGATPPGLHKAPAVMNANVHSVCVR